MDEVIVVTQCDRANPVKTGDAKRKGLIFRRNGSQLQEMMCDNAHLIEGGCRPPFFCAKHVPNLLGIPV